MLETQGNKLIADNAHLEGAKAQFVAAITKAKARSILKAHGARRTAHGVMINNSMQAFVDARYKNLSNKRVGTFEQFGTGITCVLLWSVTAGCTTGQTLRLDAGSYPATF